METSTSNLRPPSEAILAARAAVSALGAQADAAAVERALGVAEIAGALGLDDEVVLGALTAPLLGHGVDEETAIRHFGAEAVRLARELGRLGSFGVRWDPASKLSTSQAETLRKMLLAVVSDPRLILLRLAEELYVLRRAKLLGAPEQRRVAMEAREIYAPLANRLGIWQLKWELEDLAFRYLDPDNYRAIAAALNSRRADRERYIEQVRARLQAELAKAGIAAEVSGRPKHIHSIWKKMQRKHLPFDQLFDVRAFRILVDTVADCYAALGVVHGLWPYIESEFDDYIATPKNNHYRSLHTAVYGPGHQPLEVQIRTREMHEHAELGVAAHWKYKEGGGRGSAYDAKIAWVRQLLEPAAQLDGDFIDRVRGELFDVRVYALTPKGEVIDLPKGATPLDFAYHVHTGLGHRSRGAKVNGRIVPLTHQLKNGDVVEILTGKVLQPNRDWMNIALGYLASARSREKVRAFFRKLDEKDTEPKPAPPPVRVIAPRRAPRTAAVPKGVIIEGLGDLTSNIARCCNPAPPDPIVGYITLSRGVSIHRPDCPSLLRMKALRPQRLFNVEWGAVTRKRVAKN